MADVKIIEVRDRATFIPMLALRLDPVNESERFLAAMAGYGTTAEDQKKYILMTPLACGDRCEYDPYAWGGRTKLTAHEWLLQHWDEIKTGDVVDVEYILGEVAKPKVSEREEMQEAKS